MEILAELVKVKILGKNMYQVNFIDHRTGMYINCSSQTFDTIDQALEYVGTSHKIVKSCVTLWSVIREECVWEYREDLKICCWVEKSHKRITTYRTTRMRANMDFKELGFELENEESKVQCNDRITPNHFWVRHIVQMNSFGRGYCPD